MTPQPETGSGLVADPPPAAPSLGRSITRNTLFTIAGRFLYVAGWALVTPFMLARLGTERFGLWSLVTVFSGLYVTFDLGLASALTKFVAEFRTTGDHRSLRRIYTFGAALYLALGLLFVAAVVLLRGPLLNFFHIAPALRAEATWALIGAACVYIVLNLYMLLASVLTGLHRLDLWSRISMTVTLIQLAGIWAVLSLGGGLRELILNTGITLVLGAWLCRRSIAKIAPEIGLDRSGLDPSLIRRVTQYSLALQIINLGALVQFQLDKILFGRFLTLSAVGDYELGYRVTLALWSVPALLLPALLPAIAHLDAGGDWPRIKRLYRRASRYVLAVAFPLSAAIIALAPPLFVAWVGPGHANAARAAMALGALLGVNILTGVGSSVVRGIGRPRLEAEYHVLAIVLHVTLSLLLIPRFGFTGGLWGLFLSGAIGSLYFLWRFHRFAHEPLGPFAVQVLARPLVAAVLGGLAAWWLAGAAKPDLESLSRTAALGRTALGAAGFLVVAGAVLLATRYVAWSEVREMLAFAGRGAGARSDSA